MTADRLPKRPGRRLAGLACYYGILLGFFAGIWIFNAYSILARPLSSSRHREKTRVRIQNLMRLFVALLKATGLFHLRYENMKGFSRLRGEIIVANHPSMLDAPLLLCLSPNLVCLYKASLHGRLLSSVTASMAGYIANDEGLLSIRKAVRELRAGNNLLVFPEGTRTERWPLNPLHKGYALIAREARAPIRLVAIENRTDLLSKAAGFLRPPRLPAGFTLRLGPTLDPAAFPHVNALNRHVEDSLANMEETAYQNEFTFPLTRRQSEGARSRYTVTVPENPAFCRDHFPGRPLLPAYAVLLFCRYAVERTGHLRPVSWRWEQVKFLRPLVPGSRLVMTLETGRNGVILNLEENGNSCFSGHLARDS